MKTLGQYLNQRDEVFVELSFPNWKKDKKKMKVDVYELSAKYMVGKHGVIHKAHISTDDGQEITLTLTFDTKENTQKFLADNPEADDYRVIS